MSDLKTCKLDSECTEGRPGGCCLYVKLVSLGTVSDNDIRDYKELSDYTGIN